jgi:hypothetical protein
MRTLARIATAIAYILAVALIQQPPAATISAYDVYWGLVKTDSTSADALVVLRRFQLDGKRNYLVVNASSLVTSVMAADSISVDRTAWPKLRKKLAATIYGKALASAEKRSDSLQDAGITHVSRADSGVDLTIDLCPTKRPLVRSFFTRLEQELDSAEKPVPMAISLTGSWMKEHPDDLAWLKGQVDSGLIAVTWINHSFNHRSDTSLALRQNFLLEPGTNISEEVLATEKMMLANGLVPSIFFRFPGLVSDDSVFHKVTAFGVIPIGSDAWLAKGEWPEEGSIVLVHANGNDPMGIKRFFEIIDKEKAHLRTGAWKLRELSESVAAAERGK